MSLNRRQFLILGGFAFGVSASGLFARSTFHPEASPQSSATSSPVSATAANPPVPAAKVAPQGLYAPERGDVRLVVISDLNSRYGSTTYRSEVEKAMQLIPDWQPDLVICAGDMVAGQSISLTPAEIEAMWVGFDRAIFTPIRQAGLPFAFTLGNHDASSYKNKGKFVFALDREAANAYWNDPQRDLGIEFSDRAGFPFYYSFVQNQIFYLIWDASSANVPDEQMAWAERALASEAAQRAKLRIALGHLPFYAISQGRDRAGEILNRADELRSLLERYGVHTYISGHHHAYYPGRVGKMQLLHCGALGSGPRTWLGTTSAAMHALTVVDINLDVPSTTYTTYDAVTWDVVDDSQLPRLIVSPNGRILRRDLTLANLTPEEQNRPYVPSLH
jgi:predicted MPP superfamily phosphohydrolase